MLPKKLPRKFASLLLCSGVLFLLYSALSVNNREYHSTFDYECLKNNTNTLPYELHYCIKGPKIFFTETSGSPKLTPRQACAVESTARSNPSMSVAVLMTPERGVNYSDFLINELLTLPNVAIQQIDVDVFVHGTPIWEWFRDGKWKKSKFQVCHLSDALRFMIVWKYGGMYLDLDIVTLRSLEHLRSTVITENWDRVASGILIFERGHELMRRSMEDFALHYDKDNFANNGPGVISRNIRLFCDIQDMGKVSGAECDVNILPPEAAFPVKWDEWEKYFEPTSEQNITVHFNSSYMIHVWNKYSKEGTLRIGDNSLYELAIKERCPLVYKYAQKLKHI